MRQLSLVSDHSRLGPTSSTIGHAFSRVFSWHTLRLIALFIGIPAVLTLDFLYFSIARPSCPACASFPDFIKTSSLTVGYLTSTPHLAYALSVLKKL